MVWMKFSNWNPLYKPDCLGVTAVKSAECVLLLLWLWCLTVIVKVLSAKFATMSCCLQGRCPSLDWFIFYVHNIFSLIFITFPICESEKIHFLSFHPLLHRGNRVSLFQWTTVFTLLLPFDWPLWYEKLHVETVAASRAVYISADIGTTPHIQLVVLLSVLSF